MKRLENKVAIVYGEGNAGGAMAKALAWKVHRFSNRRNMIR